MGALLGLGLASLLLSAVLALAPSDLLRLNAVEIDAPVLWFVLALAVVCTVLFGLAPARKASAPDLNSGLRQNSARGSVGGGGNRMRSALVVAEVALSVILLTGAGLLLRSLLALTHVDLGFATERRLLAVTTVPARDARQATEFYRDLIDRTRALPGVRRAAEVTILPSGRRSDGSYSIEGRPEYAPGEAPNAQFQIVTPGYFAAMGISLRRGRDFAGGDVLGRPQVAIINEALAREAFGTVSPLGRRVKCGMTMESANGMEIVGVVGDARQIAPGEPPKPEIFMPYLQHTGPGSRLTLVVQTELEPYALVSALRATAAQMKPELPVRFRTLREVVDESLAYPRFRGVLIGCFALLAACLAVVGIYGVISYVVGRRTSEIGLRFALGARPQDVFRSIIGGSLRLILWGLLLGLAGTLVLSRFLRTLLYGVGAQDPLTVACVLLVLTLTALAGSSVPALRAARLDPLSALRQE